jgi:putative ABC transport system permease protein
MRRNPFRTFLMGLGVAVAAAAMTAVALLVTGVRQGVQRTVDRLGADLMVVPKGEIVARSFNEALISGKPASFYLDEPTFSRISQVPGITAISAQTFVETLANARCCAGEFFVVGFEPETDFTVTPWVKGGGWRGRAGPPRAPARGPQNWMLVGDRILLRVGDKAQFYGTTFTVAGVLEPTGGGMDWTLYIPDTALRRMATDSRTRAEAPLRVPERSASALFIKAVPGADLIDLAERIEAAAPGVQVIMASTVGAIARRQMSGIVGVLASLVVGLWAIAMLLSGVVFSQAVRERRSEIGLLKAKGADRRFVLTMLAQESALVAAASSVTGCLAAWTLILMFRGLLAHALGVPDVLPGATTVLALVVALSALVTASSVATALGPVLPVLGMEPYEAIRKAQPA